MDGKTLQGIRRRLELSTRAFGEALGYRGNASMSVRRLECSQRQVPRYLARLAFMFKLFGVPDNIEESEK